MQSAGMSSRSPSKVVSIEMTSRLLGSWLARLVLAAAILSLPIVGPYRAFAVHSMQHNPVRIVSAERGEIALSLRFSDMLIDTVSLDGILCPAVNIPGFYLGTSSDPGRLPVIRELVAIPACTGLNVEFEVQDSLVVDFGLPASTPEIDPGSNQSNLKNTASETNSGKLVRLKGIFRLRDQFIADIEIHPLKHDTARGKLVIYNRAAIRLHPESPTGSRLVPMGPYDTVAEHVLLGHDKAADQDIGALSLGSSGAGRVDWCNSVDECVELQTDYLMLTADEFFAEGDSTSAAFALGQHRATFSCLNVAIVNVDNLGLDMEAHADTLIKTFIDSLYLTHSAEHLSDGRLGYVLLVGGFVDSAGDTLVPVHWEKSTKPDLYTEYFPSDNWFVALRDSGEYGYLVPQIEIGRLAVLDSMDLEVVTYKITGSEPMRDSSRWSARVLLTSANNVDPFPSDEGPILESTFAEVSDIALAANYDTVLFRGDQLPRSYDFTGENCRLVNEGARFVYFGIHGSRYQMGMPPNFLIDSLGCLSNLDSLPVVFTGGCKTASFDSLCITPWGSAGGIGASLVNCRDGGSVAFLGPADAGRLSADFPACVDVFASWVEYGCPLLGDALVEAKLRHVGVTSFLESFTLIGDPAFNVLLKESGAEYCDLGVRSDEFKFHPHLETKPDSTVISIPIHNLTPYMCDSDTTKVHFYCRFSDSTQWSLVGECVAGPVPARGSIDISAGWDLADLDPSRGLYDVRVVLDPSDRLPEAYENNNTATITVSIGEYPVGFPVFLGAAPVTSPIVTPLIVNGALVPHVIVCTRDGKVHFATSSGQVVGTYVAHTDSIYSVAVGDLCRDGSTLQVVASGEVVCAIDAMLTRSEQLKWEIDLPGDARARTSPSLTDLDFDGKHNLEVLVGAADGSSSKLIAIDCSCDSAWVMWSTSLGDTNTIGCPVDPLALLRLNDDSVDDVVVGTTRGRLIAVDGATGRIYTARDISATDEIAASNPASSDLDLDGVAEVVCASTSIQVFTADTLLTEEASLSLDGGVGIHVCAANIDSWGQVAPEVILASDSGLTVFDYVPLQSPSLVRRFTCRTSHPVNTIPAIGDMKEPEGLEIAFTSGDSLLILSASGELVGAQWIAGSVNSSPCLADLTGTGHLEVFVGGADNTLRSEIGRGSTQQVEWPMFGGDIRNRGVRDQVLSGSVSADQTLWGKVTVVGEVSIPAQRTLMIEPGTTIEFAPGAGYSRDETSLIVDGGLLVAMGTPEERILFTASGFMKSRGDWDAVSLLQWPDTARFAYCDFEFAYDGIRAEEGALVVDNCEFSECADCGVLIDWNVYGTTSIRNCRFEKNSRSIWAWRSSALVESCSFFGNDILDVHLSFDNGSRVIGNTFNGAGLTSGAISLAYSSDTTVIADNWIEYYRGVGISSGSGCDRDWIISNNVVRYIDGTGMSFCRGFDYHPYSGHAVVDSNIIFRCGYGVWSNARGYTYGDYPVLAENSISDSYYKDAKNVDPDFEISAENNWWDFDCSDPESVAAHIEGLFDIDPCLETDPFANVVTVPDVFAEAELLPNAPNPFRDNTSIAFVVVQPARARLSIYDVRGKLVKQLVDGFLPPGRHEVIWGGRSSDGSPASPGIYFCYFTMGHVSSTSKIVLLK